ncbi:MAG: hypothetical protein NTX79_03870 [Candidatus Micrarchaeota archaeon]|nr:hypothetical protein [Candidatus Micrarchaeota archaeon]
MADNDKQGLEGVPYSIPAIISDKADPHEKAEEIDGMLRDVLKGDERAIAVLDRVKRDMGNSAYENFLLILSDATVATEGLTFQKNPRNTQDGLGLLVSSLGDDFYGWLGNKEGAFEKMKAPEKIALFKELVFAGTAAARHLKNPDIGDFTFFTEELENSDFLLRPENSGLRTKILDKYVSILAQERALYDAGTSKVEPSHALSLLKTLDYFLGNAHEEGRDDLQNKTIEDIFKFGFSASQLEQNPSYEAFWSLRILSRDKPIGEKLETLKVEADFLAKIIEQGEKEPLRYLENLLYRGLPDTKPETLDKFLKLHRYFGIANADRLWKQGDMRLVDELIKNYEDPSYNSGKDVLIVVLPRGGAGNSESLMGLMGASDTFRNLQDTLFELSKHYKLYVFEAGSVPQFGVIRDAVEANEGGNLAKRGFGMIYAGHGEPGDMALNSSLFGETHVETNNKAVKPIEGKKDSSIRVGSKSIIGSEFYPASPSDTRVDANEKKDQYYVGKLTAGAKFAIYYGCSFGGKNEKGKANIVDMTSEKSPGTIVVGAAGDITGAVFNLKNGFFPASIEGMRNSVIYKNGEVIVPSYIRCKGTPIGANRQIFN